MPSSLRLVLILLGVGVALTFGSLPLQRMQTQKRAEAAAAALTGGAPEAGKAAIGRYRCGACHSIPGVPRADGRTGPSLANIATQGFLAGRLPNEPDAMIAWVRAPQSINPGGGMPNLGVSEQEGRDIAAYLYTLR